MKLKQDLLGVHLRVTTKSTKHYKSHDKCRKETRIQTQQSAISTKHTPTPERIHSTTRIKREKKQFFSTFKKFKEMYIKYIGKSKHFDCG